MRLTNENITVVLAEAMAAISKRLLVASTLPLAEPLAASVDTDLTSGTVVLLAVTLNT
jgi:hypothetical protein